MSLIVCVPSYVRQYIEPYLSNSTKNSESSLHQPHPNIVDELRGTISLSEVQASDVEINGEGQALWRNGRGEQRRWDLSQRHQRTVSDSETRLRPTPAQTVIAVAISSTPGIRLGCSYKNAWLWFNSNNNNNNTNLYSAIMPLGGYRGAEAVCKMHIMN